MEAAATGDLLRSGKRRGRRVRRVTVALCTLHFTSLVRSVSCPALTNTGEWMKENDARAKGFRGVITRLRLHHGHARLLPGWMATLIVRERADAACPSSLPQGRAGRAGNPALGLRRHILFVHDAVVVSRKTGLGPH